MNQALIYKRVSTDKQDNSLLIQENGNELYCLQMHFPVAGIIEDPDTSAMMPMAERHGGANLLKRVKNEAIKHVVFSCQDRLGRDQYDQIGTARILWSRGITIHFACQGGPIPRTPENEMMFGVKAAMGQYERDLIRGRIQRTMTSLFERGLLTGNVPFGFDCKYLFSDGSSITTPVAFRNSDIALAGRHVVSKELVDNPAEQFWIHQIAEWRAGHVTLNKIAKLLNERGVKSKTPAGTPIFKTVAAVRTQVGTTSGKWQAGNVKSLLESRHTAKVLATKPHPNNPEQPM